MKTCIECKHWYFDSGYPRQSDVTPGSDGLTGCLQKQWINWPCPSPSDGLWRLHDLDRGTYRKFLEQAETCKFFEYRKEEE